MSALTTLYSDDGKRCATIFEDRTVLLMEDSQSILVDCTALNPFSVAEDFVNYVPVA